MAVIVNPTYTYTKLAGYTTDANSILFNGTSVAASALADAVGEVYGVYEITESLERHQWRVTSNTSTNSDQTTRSVLTNLTTGQTVYDTGLLTVLAPNGTQNYYSDLNSLQLGNQYRVTISHYTVNGNEMQRATATWTMPAPPTPPPAPSTPSGLTLTNRGQTSLSMSWSSSSGATGYQVRNNTLTTTWTNVSSQVSYTFSGLNANTSYSLQVRAYATGTGGTSYSGTATLSATTLPASFSTPNVIGQNFNTAATNLRNAGFSSVNQLAVTVGATSANNLLVKLQAPTAGTTANVGDVASIDYYNYLLPVPNILGQTQAEANTSLGNAGFLYRTSTLTTVGATVANNLLVKSQNPTGGTSYNVASTVTFEIYNFLTAVPNVVTQLQDTAITTLRNLGFTSIVLTLDEAGATIDNVNTIKSQSPVNSATTYNPKNQTVSLVVYSLGITGKRNTGTTHVPLTTAKRYTGTEWKPLTVQKRFNGTAWIDIAN